MNYLVFTGNCEFESSGVIFELLDKNNWHIYDADDLVKDLEFYKNTDADLDDCLLYISDREYIDDIVMQLKLREEFVHQSPDDEIMSIGIPVEGKNTEECICKMLINILETGWLTTDDKFIDRLKLHLNRRVI